jgi:hypothetical protein
LELFVDEEEDDWMCEVIEAEEEEAWMRDEEDCDWCREPEEEMLLITPDLSRSASTTFEAATYDEVGLTSTALVIDTDKVASQTMISGLGLYILPSKGGYYEAPKEDP